MLKSIYNVFQRHKLLNRLKAQYELYTVEMRAGERMLSNTNRVQHPGWVLKSMSVDIDRNEVAMAILKGLPCRYDNIITALDAVGDENALFTLENVKSCLIQDEQRRNMKGSVEETETAFLSRIQKQQEASISGRGQGRVRRRAEVSERLPYGRRRQVWSGIFSKKSDLC